MACCSRFHVPLRDRCASAPPSLALAFSISFYHIITNALPCAVGRQLRTGLKPQVFHQRSRLSSARVLCCAAMGGARGEGQSEASGESRHAADEAASEVHVCVCVCGCVCVCVCVCIASSVQYII